MTAAVIVLTRKRYIRRFREAGATRSESAISLSQIGMRNTWIFRQMVSRGVFVDCGDGRYYMDVVAAERFLAAQRSRALFITAILLVIFILVLFWTSK